MTLMKKMTMSAKEDKDFDVDERITRIMRFWVLGTLRAHNPEAHVSLFVFPQNLFQSNFNVKNSPFPSLFCFPNLESQISSICDHSVA
ncbi:hypothetical protein L6452_15835 [Arctium lappa]|uniref:Uncharacterized protein n=1 Tax=Arctium lappa TaxID=4217 RepID=A0ACB9CPZ5_ARCLA|nr:hypothetical protein L6452_15835 [Arctium lappa]